MTALSHPLSTLRPDLRRTGPDFRLCKMERSGHGLTPTSTWFDGRRTKILYSSMNRRQPHGVKQAVRPRRTHGRHPEQRHQEEHAISYDHGCARARYIARLETIYIRDPPPGVLRQHLRLNARVNCVCWHNHQSLFPREGSTSARCQEKVHTQHQASIDSNQLSNVQVELGAKRKSSGSCERIAFNAWSEKGFRW